MTAVSSFGFLPTINTPSIPTLFFPSTTIKSQLVISSNILQSQDKKIRFHQNYYKRASLHMASLQASNFLVSSSSKPIRAALSVPKLPSIQQISIPKVQTNKSLPEGLNINRNGFIKTIPVEDQKNAVSPKMATVQQLYAVLEAVADRVEMHHNVGEQRENWNALLLNSINMMTLTAATMAGITATGGAGVSVLGLKLASTLLFSSAAGMLAIMNKIQPSQLVEEQRNATRLFKQLQTQIKTLLEIGSPKKEDVKNAMEKVLALDKAYPLPLIGVMLEKFPESLEPAVWWPKSKTQSPKAKNYFLYNGNNNGWSEELEMEMREIVEVIKRKDSEDYERLGNKALKINKFLAKAGPMLTGVAALSSAFMDSSNGHWAAILAAAAGSLASAVNSFEHGGQVGMVFEMYRNNAGFFKLVQETIESNLNEPDFEKRENGEVFETKVAMQLGRSLSQLRDVAKKASYSRIEGSPIDEFASKLF